MSVDGHHLFSVQGDATINLKDARLIRDAALLLAGPIRGAVHELTRAVAEDDPERCREALKRLFSTGALAGGLVWDADVVAQETHGYSVRVDKEGGAA